MFWESDRRFCSSDNRFTTLKTKGCVQWLHHLDVVAKQHWSDSQRFHFLGSSRDFVLRDYCTWTREIETGIAAEEASWRAGEEWISHLYFSECRRVRQVNECAERRVWSEQPRLKHALLPAGCSIELSSHSDGANKSQTEHGRENPSAEEKRGSWTGMLMRRCSDRWDYSAGRCLRTDKTCLLRLFLRYIVVEGVDSLHVPDLLGQCQNIPVASLRLEWVADININAP